MANPAAQARANAQAKWNGATVAERGRNFIRHQHPTELNRFMLDIHTGPIHYGPGEDQEIDTAWQPTTGAWDWEMTTNDFQTYARDVFNAGDLFQFEKDGQSLAFDPQSINWIDENDSRQQIAIKQAINATVNDAILSWPEAYGAGRHFQYQNQTARLQKLITIDNLSDLPAVTLQGNTIWFEAEFSMSLSAGIDFYIDGALWTRQNGQRVRTANYIEVRDAATGTQVLWWLGLPNAFDADGNETIGQLEARRDGGPSNLFITVRIPKTWIDAAVFPIHIDPTIDETTLGINDNAWEAGDTGISNLRIRASSNTTSGNEDHGGAHFNGVALDGTETIDAGTVVQVWAFSTSLDDPYTNLHCHDVDNSPDFASPNDDVYNRATTTAFVLWNETGIGASAYYDSPDIDTEVQEVIDRGGWANGNDLTVLFKGTNDVSNSFHMFSYQNDSAKAPKLHIEYTAASTGLSVNISTGANFVQVV